MNKYTSSHQNEDHLIAVAPLLLKALERLVLAFDVGDMAHTAVNGRGYAALEEARLALVITRESAADPSKLVYATDERRHGVFGWERVWTTNRELAKTFTAEEVARKEARMRERDK